MAKPASRAAAAACPCGSGSAYSRCCKPFHLRTAAPPTAEALMASRYSAFAKGLESYLRYSWHPRQIPDEVTIDARQVWTALRIVSTSDGKAGDDHGTVEFEATCEVDGRRRVMHEVSGFARFEGRWVYTEPVDVNRSDPAR